MEKFVNVTVRLQVAFQPEDYEGVSDTRLTEMAVRETRLLYETGREIDGYWGHSEAEDIEVTGKVGG